jgi:hypothetical protein
MFGAIVLAAATVLLIPVAASAITRDPEVVARHVRRLEVHNHFGIRARIGGPFTVSKPYCDTTSTFGLYFCFYDVSAKQLEDAHHRRTCSVFVRVHLGTQRRPNRWHRRVTACTDQFVP